MQTRAASLLEACASTAVGYAVSVLATLIVLPWFGLAPAPADAFGISAIFTLISVLRGYALRRLFARMEAR